MPYLPPSPHHLNSSGFASISVTPSGKSGVNKSIAVHPVATPLSRGGLPFHGWIQTTICYKVAVLCDNPHTKNHLHLFSHNSTNVTQTQTDKQPVV